MAKRSTLHRMAKVHAKLVKEARKLQEEELKKVSKISFPSGGVISKIDE